MRVPLGLRVVALGVCALLCGGRRVSAQAAPPPPIKVGPVTVGGYVQLDYRAPLEDEAPDHDALTEEDATFAAARIRLGVGGPLGSRVSWYVQGDLAHVTEDEVLRDAYVAFTASDSVAVRFGQFTIPFSLERTTSTSRLEVIDRSVIGTLMSPSRDFGLLVYSPKPLWGWVSYWASVINGSGQNEPDNNGAKDLVLRVATRVPRVPGLSVGINGTTGEQPDGTRRRLGADAAYERGPIRLAVETVSQSFDGDAPRDAAGYYVLGVWRHPAPKLAPLYAGYELVARFVDVEDEAFLLESKTLQFGGNYYVTPQVRIMNNLVVPFDDDQPRPRTRWWSRVQVVF